MASTTSGPARPTLRSASPTVEPWPNAFTIAPNGDGVPYGCAPTAIVTPMRMSATKYARCFQRTNIAAMSAVTGIP